MRERRREARRNREAEPTSGKAGRLMHRPTVQPTPRRPAAGPADRRHGEYQLPASLYR